MPQQASSPDYENYTVPTYWWKRNRPILLFLGTEAAAFLGPASCCRFLEEEEDDDPSAGSADSTTWTRRTDDISSTGSRFRSQQQLPCGCSGCMQTLGQWEHDEGKMRVYCVKGSAFGMMDLEKERDYKGSRGVEESKGWRGRVLAPRRPRWCMQNRHFMSSSSTFQLSRCINGYHKVNGVIKIRMK